MHADMIYDGTTLVWGGQGTFHATSGLPGHQTAAEQTVKDAGPIPEGQYSMLLKIAGTAHVIDPDAGKLDTNPGVESLVDMPGPDGRLYESSAWGKNRIRLNPLAINNPKARSRGGFYLHDSPKGYSHGCVEVETRFFTQLRQYVAQESKKPGGKKKLVLQVKYPSGSASTYGGTKQP
jgi:hypothetical protein